MLRRIADSLFWAARYIERAEWRARLVSVNHHLLIEGPAPAGNAWSSLLAISGDRELFEQHYARLDESSVLNFFVLDERNPSSIRSCIHAARANARSLRHRISSELWLELNTLHLDARTWSPARMESGDVFEFFSSLQERFYRVAGVINGTLPRGLGFDFLVLGQVLERAENVTRLLDIKYHYLLPRVEDVGGPLDLLQWASVLRSASALEAYRLTYGNMIRTDHVVELLLFDGTFPRSARFCVDCLEAALRRIAQSAPDPAATPVPLASDALAGLLASRSAGDVIASGLHDFLLGVQEECQRISSAVFDQYLRFE
ncbi:MAG: alpha-E domain-containing protein [Thermodesulfobacteriota bacterium]